MEAIRDSIIRSKFLYSDTCRKETLKSPNYVLIYSEPQFNGWYLCLDKVGKVYKIRFGCQSFSLERLKEMRDNLNGKFNSKLKQFVLVEGKQKAIVNEDETYVYVKNGDSYTKSTHVLMDTRVIVKVLSKRVTTSYSYYSGVKKSNSYFYKKFNIGNNKKRILATLEYCIGLLEEVEYLENLNK